MVLLKLSAQVWSAPSWLISRHREKVESIGHSHVWYYFCTYLTYSRLVYSALRSLVECIMCVQLIRIRNNNIRNVFEDVET